jgi:hypothetical protein
MEAADLPSLLVAAVAAVIALMSAVYARRADETAKGALHLAERAFAGERCGQIRTIRQSDGKILVEPLAPDSAISKVLIVFPTALELPPLEIVSPDLYFNESRIARHILRFWDQRTVGKAAHAIVRKGLTGTIPVAVVVHSYARGEASVSTSLYDLRTTFVKLDRGDGSFDSSVTVDALSFNNMVPDDVDPLPILDSVVATDDQGGRDA